MYSRSLAGSRCQCRKRCLIVSFWRPLISPKGSPGEAARLSLMIGMRALGSGLTSKLVSWVESARRPRV